MSPLTNSWSFSFESKIFCGSGNIITITSVNDSSGIRNRKKHKPQLIIRGSTKNGVKISIRVNETMMVNATVMPGNTMGADETPIIPADTWMKNYTTFKISKKYINTGKYEGRLEVNGRLVEDGFINVTTPSFLRLLYASNPSDENDMIDAKVRNLDYKILPDGKHRL